MDVESLLLLWVELEQLLAGSHGLDGVLNFTGELPDVGQVLLPNLLLALAPVGGTHVLYHGFVSVLDHFVQLDQALGRYFSEDDFVVIGLQQVYLTINLYYFVFHVVFSNREVFDKVDRFFLQFFLVPVGDEKTGIRPSFFHFIPLDVDDLIVDQNLPGPVRRKEVLQHQRVFVLRQEILEFTYKILRRSSRLYADNPRSWISSILRVS